MTNYNDFLEKTPYTVLSYETAMEVFDKLMSSLPEDEDSRELLEDLINSIYTYAETRAHCYLMSKEWRKWNHIYRMHYRKQWGKAIFLR